MDKQPQSAKREAGQYFIFAGALILIFGLFTFMVLGDGPVVLIMGLVLFYFGAWLLFGSNANQGIVEAFRRRDEFRSKKDYQRVLFEIADKLEKSRR